MWGIGDQLAVVSGHSSESGLAGLEDTQDCETVVTENYGNVLFVSVIQIYEVNSEINTIKY